MDRQKLFLDTNICIGVANGIIDPEEWRRVKKQIGSTFRYYISFITRKELLSKMARGSDEYFHGAKNLSEFCLGQQSAAFCPIRPCSQSGQYWARMRWPERATQA